MERNHHFGFRVDAQAFAFHMRNMKLFLDNDQVGAIVPHDPSTTLIELIRALHRFCNCIVVHARNRNTRALLDLKLLKAPTDAATLQAGFIHNSQRAHWNKEVLKLLRDQAEILRAAKAGVLARLRAYDQPAQDAALRKLGRARR